MLDLQDEIAKRLQESVVSDQYKILDEPKDIIDIEGLVDGILVVTDPEITSDEYEEMIDRANEIVSDTPEGELPFSEDYVGNYIQLCPLCGQSFITPTIKEVGDTCPVCLEVPQAFVLLGKLSSEEEEAEKRDLNQEEEEEEVSSTPNTQEASLEDDFEDGEDNTELDLASKQIGNGNKLAENKELKTELYDPIESKVPDLAGDLAEYMSNFNVDVFYDAYDEVEDAFNDYMEQLTTNEGRESFITELMDIANNCEVESVIDKANELIKRIESLDKELKTEVYNEDGFPNSEELVEFFTELNNLPDELTIDGEDYFMEQYGGNGANSWCIYTSKENEDSYIKVFYSLKKVGDNSYKGIDTIKGVSDLRESKCTNESDCQKIQEDINDTMSFEDIILGMETVETYDEMYNLADEIVNMELRSNVKDMIDVCKRDGDDLETCWSLVSTVYLDDKIYNNNDEKLTELDESKELIESHIEDETLPDENQRYTYMLLDRLRMDCDYYLGNGGRFDGHLWAGNVDGQIAKMKELWNKLKEKPEWLTMEQIEDYAKRMGATELPSTADGTAEKEIQNMLDRSEKRSKENLDESKENEGKEIKQGRIIKPVYRCTLEGFIKKSDGSINGADIHWWLKDLLEREGNHFDDKGNMVFFEQHKWTTLDESKLLESNDNGIIYTIKLNTKNMEDDETEIRRVLGILGKSILEHDVSGQTFDKEGEKCLEFTSEEGKLEETKLQETGEWDDDDEEMSAWKEDLGIMAEELASQINGEVKVVKGFDKYQGPFAIVSTPNHGDIELWYNGEDETGRSFVAKIAHFGWISGDINKLAGLLNQKVIPETEKIEETVDLNVVKANEENKLLESTAETEITIDEPISTLIVIADDREQWDYPLEDIDEARANNEYLVIDNTDKRVYEVTEEEFNYIKNKVN